MFYLILLSFLINSVLATNNTEPLQCNQDIKDMIYLNKDKERPQKCDVDGTELCILKCCGENEIILEEDDVQICTSINKIDPKVKLNYSSINVYHKNNLTEELEVSKTKKFSDFHKFYNKDFIQNDCSYSVKLIANISSYLLEDGSWIGVYEETPLEPYPQFQFCVDLLVLRENGTDYPPEITFNYIQDNSGENCDHFMHTVTIISIVFLTMTIIVQCVLRRYHKMVDKLILTYIGMLTLAFLFKMILFGVKQNVVEYYPAIISCSLFYYCYLSSFFWINIASFVIWWALRGTRLQRRIHHRGVNSKYRQYCLYACGVPLLITGFVIMVETDVIPNITKPNLENCFHGEADDMRYIYVPLGILTFLNLVLFVMTLYNIWLVQYAPEIRNSTNTIIQKNRFNKFTKLSMMMGISWILEAIQGLFSNGCDPYYYILNTYNGLIGVIIFFIFVCNKSNYKQFCRRFNIKSKYVVSHQDSSIISHMSSQKSNSIKLIRQERASGLRDSAQPPRTNSILLDGY